jgi:hypothetical protein
MLLWQDPDRTPVAQFGIAGDFLPASGLVPAPGQTWSQMAEDIRPLFEDLNFSIVNLECPVGVDGLTPRVKASAGDTFASGSESLTYLLSLRASVVGMANNHSCDYGLEGVDCTRRELLQRSLYPVGTGRTLCEAPNIHIQEIFRGLRVGVWVAARNLPYSATRKNPGMEPATLARGMQALNSIDAAGASCRVAYLHAGTEGTDFPDPEDVALVDALAHSGFDIVAVCHSHRISGYRTFDTGRNYPSHCFYGLGSLSSGVLYSDLEREGLLSVVGLDEKGQIVRLEIRPIFLDSCGRACIPWPEKTSLIVTRFEEISAQIRNGNYRNLFYRDISKSLLQTQTRDIRIAFERAGFRGILQKLTRLRPAHVRRLYHKGLAAIGLS